MGTPWYGFNITQSYGQNGEKGIDLGTKYGTPITALYGGTVRWSGRTQWSCGSSGGEVTIVCNVPGYGILTSYYLHLDSVTVAPGDTVEQGQVIGMSGGQLSGGNWPVVNCPSKGITYSTGAHTEFGFNAPWVSGPGKNIDPTFAILQARSNTLPIVQPDGTVQTQAYLLGAQTVQQTYSLTSLESVMMKFYNVSHMTQGAISQPEGFDGICEALDAAEQFPQWNWLDLGGSLFFSAKPWMVRSTIMFLAGAVAAAVIWEWIKGPADAVAGFVAKAGISAAAPEAAPVIMGMAPQKTAS